MSEVRMERKRLLAKVSAVCIGRCMFYMARDKGLNFRDTRQPHQGP